MTLHEALNLSELQFANPNRGIRILVTITCMWISQCVQRTQHMPGASKSWSPTLFSLAQVFIHIRKMEPVLPPYFMVGETEAQRT